MIRLAYGDRQHFRFRYKDITILGSSDAALPARRSEYRLNEGPPVHFYIEPEVAPTGPGPYPYGLHTPSAHRLRDRPGHFNLEIPVDTPEMSEGWNHIRVEIEDRTGRIHHTQAEFHWDSRPVTLPLDLSDLSGFRSVQDVGQVVNGTFDLDPKRNVIRSRAPVGSDALCLLGPPHGSQEATYEVRFSGRKGTFLGLSDFFVGHEEQSPDLGIKPGYSTAGLATLTPRGYAAIWLAAGDNLMGKENAWVVTTVRHYAKTRIRMGVTYRVRHQTIMTDGLNFSRFRIWKEGTREPEGWLCEEHNAHLRSENPRHDQASFGLFQYFGLPTEWTNIRVKSLAPEEPLELRSTSVRRALWRWRAAQDKMFHSYLTLRGRCAELKRLHPLGRRERLDSRISRA